MGISLEQYRSAIGTWNTRHTKNSDKDNTAIILEEPELPKPEKIFLRGPWKLYALILVLMLITAGLLASPVSCSSPPAHVSTTYSENTGTQASTAYSLCTETTEAQAISKQCLLNLLMIGGVEQNPGPATLSDIEELDTIIAELSSSTDNMMIRDTIRLYDPRMDTKTLERNINNGASKDKIVETLAHLGMPNMHKYNKGACVTALIIRIQNLFPDTCSHCKEQYCIKLGDTPLLICAICQQGSHDPCLLKHLQIPDDEKDSITPDSAWKRLNTTEMPGLHYMCSACEGMTIPSKNEGLLKRMLKSAVIDETNTSDIAVDHTNHPADNDVFYDATPAGTGSENTITTTTAAVSTPISHVIPPTSIPVVQITSPPLTPAVATAVIQGGIPPPPTYTVATSILQPATSQAMTGLNSHMGPTPEAPIANNQSVDTTDVCPFYRKGTCRFGIAGRQCPKTHPPACKKLLRHGNRAPRGCTEGRNCDKYHPTMCQSSLRKKECFNADCKLVHITGTKRIRTERNSTGTVEATRYSLNREPAHAAPPAPAAPHAPTSQQNQEYFLEALRTMQMELMREMHRLTVVRPAPTSLPPGPYLPPQHHPPSTMFMGNNLPPMTSAINPMCTWPNSGPGQYPPGAMYGNPMMMGSMPLVR